MRANESSATRKALDRGLVAAAKKEKPAEAHGIRLHPVRAECEQVTTGASTPRS